jgi:hypothetical protein
MNAEIEANQKAMIEKRLKFIAQQTDLLMHFEPKGAGYSKDAAGKSRRGRMSEKAEDEQLMKRAETEAAGARDTSSACLLPRAQRHSHALSPRPHGSARHPALMQGKTYSRTTSASPCSRACSKTAPSASTSSKVPSSPPLPGFAERPSSASRLPVGPFSSLLFAALVPHPLL